MHREVQRQNFEQATNYGFLYPTWSIWKSSYLIKTIHQGTSPGGWLSDLPCWYDLSHDQEELMSLCCSNNSLDQAPARTLRHVRQVRWIPSLLHIHLLVSVQFCFGFISSLKCQEETPEKRVSSVMDLFLPCVYSLCWSKQRYAPVTSAKCSHFLLSKGQMSRISISFWRLPWLPKNSAKWASRDGCKHSWGHGTKGSEAPSHTWSIDMWEVLLSWMQSSSSHAAWTETFTCNTLSRSFGRYTIKKCEHIIVDRE